MKERPYRYPSDGPPCHIQRLMEHPRRNRAELKKWLKDNKNMRQETKDVILLP